MIHFHEGYPILGDGNFEFLQGRSRYGQDVRDFTFLLGFFALLCLFSLGGLLNSYTASHYAESLMWLVIALVLAFCSAIFAQKRAQSKQTYEHGEVKVGRIVDAKPYSDGDGDGDTLTIEVEVDGRTAQLARNVPFSFGCGEGEEVLVLCHQENLTLM